MHSPKTQRLNAKRIPKLMHIGASENEIAMQQSCEKPWQ
jgi:hypothetical protein